VQEAVNACDVVLAVGAGLNGFTTHKETLMADAHVIHVDRDPGAFGRHRGVSSTVTGDARVVAEALLARVRRAGWRRVVRAARAGGRRDARAAAVGSVRDESSRACSTRVRCAADWMSCCPRTARS
jgi:thiamine pyrophosphate-dependent acetolactate synthase large subunit-like protein